MKKRKITYCLSFLVILTPLLVAITLLTERFVLVKTGTFKILDSTYREGHYETRSYTDFSTSKYGRTKTYTEFIPASYKVLIEGDDYPLTVLIPKEKSAALSDGKLSIRYISQDKYHLKLIEVIE